MDNYELIKTQDQLSDALATLHEAKRLIEKMAATHTDLSKEKEEAINFLKSVGNL